MRTTAMTSGVVPSGYVASARSVSTSWRGARRRSSTYSANQSSSQPSGLSADVALRAGTDLTRCPEEAETLAEPTVIGLGHAEQVGDDQHREGLRVRADELAVAVGDELVELLVGEAPHERLVLLEPLRRDEPHEQRPLPGVVRRVHRHHVLVHRELVAVADR